MHALVAAIHQSFASHADAGNAAAMEAYLKGHFPFFGIKAAERRALMQAQLKIHGKPLAEEVPALAAATFALPEREMHQAGVDLLIKAARHLGRGHLPEVEATISSKSWWDTVDALAVNVAGVILKRYPEEIPAWNDRWMDSGDMWLNRTALLFQLKWKQDTDKVMLFSNIDRLAAHRDFFIRKAIGWSLREYARTDPAAVSDFVASRSLSALSEREALRGIERKQNS